MLGYGDLTVATFMVVRGSDNAVAHAELVVGVVLGRSTHGVERSLVRASLTLGWRATVVQVLVVCKDDGIFCYFTYAWASSQAFLLGRRNCLHTTEVIWPALMGMPVSSSQVVVLGKVPLESPLMRETSVPGVLEGD